MSNPWLSIPLQDYEGHMGSAGVQQLSVLSELFKRALDYCLPESVAVLGVIVVIRIVLSFALEVEIDGAWPWRRPPDRRA